jgi:hypothetical protein
LVIAYPKTAGEVETLEAAIAGANLARFGDGELKIATGRDAKSQRHDPQLQHALRSILRDRTWPGLACIPTLDLRSPKLQLWRSYARPPYIQLYDQRIAYGSAFITRPDSAPWIDAPAYWERVIDVWRDRDVVLVRGSSKSLQAHELIQAKSVHEIIGPRQHAFEAHRDLLAQLKGEKDRRVLLCLGATATVLAYWLGLHHQVHAIDLGHVGMFMRREGRFERESFPP